MHGRLGENRSSLLKFLSLLADARLKVDLCIYTFTQTILADILIGLYKEGVQVRIITDCSEDEATSSQLERLGRVGIPIKSNKRGTGALMHHKFVVIDDRLLLSGSFNWTNKAVVSNYEAVLVTTTNEFVHPFRAEFDEMWSKFQEHHSTKTLHTASSGSPYLYSSPSIKNDAKNHSSPFRGRR